MPSPRPLTARWLVAGCACLAAATVATGEVITGPEPAEPAPANALVLAELCRYLKLSASQVRTLLPTVRTAERARADFARQKEEVAGRIAALGNSPEGAALRRAWDQREKRFHDELAAFAAPQLVRLFTREQVALAWALVGGHPPPWADASASLQRDFGQPGARTFFLRLGAGGDGIAVLDESGSGALTRLRLRPDAVVDTFFLDTGGRGRAILEGGAQAATRPGDDRPFPQIAVESNELQDLLPPVRRLVLKAFTSADWLSTLERAARNGVGVRPSRDHRLVPRKPTRTVRDYRMERGFRDLTGRGPALEPLGGFTENGLYRFGPGQGLRVTDLGVRDDYEIELTFRADGGPEYQKVLDFKDGKDDGGLYVHQGRLHFYGLAVGGPIIPGREHRLRLERNRETRVVRAFLDFRPAFAFIDLDDAAAFTDGKAMLFVDDGGTKTEHGPGALRYLAVRAPTTP